MKGVSELFSTMILASTIIVISIIVLYYALTTLEIGYASTEYGYIKSTFVNVANNIYYIVQGNAYAASIPSRSVGIGYKEYSDLRFRIIVDGNIIYEDTPKAVVAETLKPLVTHSEIVYGSSGNNPIGCSFMVNNLRLTPCVYEYYSRGWSIAELNTARPYVTVYEASESSFSYLRRINITNSIPIVRKYIDPEPRVEVDPEEALNGRYIVRLIYLDLEPRLQSTRPTSLLIYPHKDIVRYVASGIGSLRIELYNVSSGTVIWSADLDDIIPGRDPSKPVDIVIVVKRIYVVMA